MADKYIWELPKEDSFQSWLKKIPDCCKECEKAEWRAITSISEFGAILYCPDFRVCKNRKEEVNG